MKPVAYHRLAARELIKSAAFYERRRNFLGETFLAEVDAVLSLLPANPDLGRPEKFHTRSWKVKRFPFRLVYLEQADRIWIVAVSHLSRKPGYWHRRLE